MPRKRRNGPNRCIPFLIAEVNLEEPTIRLSQRQSLDEGSVVFYKTMHHSHGQCNLIKKSPIFFKSDTGCKCLDMKKFEW